MWKAELKIITGFAAIAAIQLGWHWLLSLPNETSQKLLTSYLSHDPKVGKGVSGWFDLFIPTVFVGLLVGRSGWEWTLRKLSLFVFIFAIGLVALLPVYVLLLNKPDVWWWPNSDTEIVGSLFAKTIQSCTMVGLFTYVGRGSKIHGHTKKSSETSRPT